jgi:predicted sulfurtransferase
VGAASSRDPFAVPPRRDSHRKKPNLLGCCTARPGEPAAGKRRLKMIRRTMTAIVALGFIVNALTPFATAAEAVRMSQEDLKLKLDDPDVVIVDVRSYTDWILSGDKIKGAQRENYRDFEGWATKYPKEKTIVLYCA